MMRKKKKIGQPVSPPYTRLSYQIDIATNDLRDTADERITRRLSRELELQFGDMWVLTRIENQ